VSRGTIGLVACSAGGVESVRVDFVEPAIERGWDVAVTLTPTAATWLEESGEAAKLEELTGHLVRSSPRMPGEKSPHPPMSCYVVAPATANVVAKLALGISDNQALTTVNEAIGGGVVPVVVFPRVNAAHTRHPAWESHLAALGSAGVHLVTGEDVWPLFEPREGPPDRPLPWSAILDLVEQVTAATR